MKCKQLALATIFLAPTFVSASTIGDFVWDDSNRNGIQDATESGLPGVTVSLWLGDNGLPDFVVDSTTTDANGSYNFTGLNPNEFFVEFGLLTGFDFTFQRAGNDSAIDSDADYVTGFSDAVVLGPE